MTAGIEKAAGSKARYFLAIAVTATALGLSACASNGPSGTSAQGASSQAGGNVVGPRDTGSYPNLNIKPGQAAPQFTDAEAQAKLSQLNAERASAQNPARSKGVKDESAALRKLAATHGPDTLRQIEGKCDPALDPTCK